VVQDHEGREPLAIRHNSPFMKIVAQRVPGWCERSLVGGRPGTCRDAETAQVKDFVKRRSIL
jgi:hypothetical protein